MRERLSFAVSIPKKERGSKPRTGQSTLETFGKILTPRVYAELNHRRPNSKPQQKKKCDNKCLKVIIKPTNTYVGCYEERKEKKNKKKGR